MMSAKNARTGIAVLACAGAASSALATPTTLPDAGISLWQILDSNGPYNGSFTVFDKQFDFSSFDGNNALADALFIKPVISDDPLDGVGFDIFANLTFGGDDDDLAAFGLSTNDLSFNLHYTVTVLDPAFMIDCAILELQATTSGGGDDDDRTNPSIDVSETFTGLGVSETLSLHNPANGHLESTMVTFDNPVSTLDVTKHVSFSGFGGGDDDILLVGDDGGTTVHLELLRQTYSQVPAPSTALAFGGFALLAARRRR